MKAKTIKALLRKKVDAWIESIEDKSVGIIARKNTIVTGGAIASMLLSEKVNDYDIYLRTESAAMAIAKYYVEQFKKNPPPSMKTNGDEIPIFIEQEGGRIKIIVKSAGIASEDRQGNYQYFEGLDDAQNIEAGSYVEWAMGIQEKENQETKPKYRPVFLSSNAITLSEDVQIIIRFFGEPDEIHANYDFVHCTNYWSSWDNSLVLRKDALETLLSKELRYVGSKYPLCSIIRTRKFISRGWRITAGQYLKMIMQVSQLDLLDLAVLEDQLIGVDVAYFIEVIEKLKEKDSTRVDYAYLLEIIERMF